GIVTALGIGWGPNAEGFRAGRNAFRPITAFDASRQRVKSAAEINLPAKPPATKLSPRQEARLDRAARQLIMAAAECWQGAGWESSATLPLVLGTTSGGMTLGEDYLKQAEARPHDRRRQPTRVSHYQCQRQALLLMDALGFTGPLTVIANACASGANAIGHAFELIRTGQSERALAGGFDGLSELVFAGFDSLQALSPTICRPFDSRRDGLGLGEGAAVLALESLYSASRRGAHILGELVGYGAATDVHHLTQPHPEGRAAVQSMQQACRVARVEPRQVGYVNAHGTGTPLNDAAEAAAINCWAGTDATKLSVSSTKGSIGHLLGAAGAVEAAVCLMALQGNWLPPSPATEQIDPCCQFDYVTSPRDARLDYALTNSFGFGGANASLIFRRWR
ncbi:MAG TPA: beta-ketoacyl-[acyl-carrier-protein] synthase family protein, partial [Verrucomicrobiales bacterium]|nr:beta-ketoacyl-[acyl-carrier-protein] synthase family protein [Verrucomicrobiales bacterium]